MTSADKMMIKTIITIEIIALLIWLILQVFIPNMKLAKLVANEASALESVKTLNVACDSYKEYRGFYPVNLMSLALENPPYIDRKLGEGSREGYNFIYERTSAGFSVRALPIKMDSTGRFIIFSDQSGIITACNKDSECNNL